MRCVFCHESAQLCEKVAPNRPYCSKPCQWLEYHLTGDYINRDTVQEVWQKVVRDVPLERLYNIVQTNEMMRTLCQSAEFRRMYYERNKDQVVAHLREQLPRFSPTVNDWLTLVLEDNPNFDRRNVILYAARYGRLDVLHRYTLTNMERRLALREALVNGRKDVVGLLWVYKTIPDWAGLAALHGNMLTFLTKELGLSPTAYILDKP